MAFVGQIHGSCVARDGAGVLLLGPSGAGKSDLALRLIDRGFALVADDRVDIAAGIARAPAELAGLIEIRGLGIAQLAHTPEVPLALVVELGVPERLPAPAVDPRFALPRITLDARAASAAQRVALALAAACARVGFVAGAFAAAAQGAAPP
ncbi:MAG: HPr kinase/phosphorylase [Acidibrevibacterium sp.]|uniref:HPr kinase/phosphorylase n=1 Tax=Acidibrevibacterium sp. TaxID=2606776 RepID=UPI003CFC609A